MKVISAEAYDMMTPEETRILNYLRVHPSASMVDVARACLSGGATMEWLERVVANLDWLGYVAVYQGLNGASATLQITEKGLGNKASRLPRSAKVTF